MRVADINVDKNFSIIEEEFQKNGHLSATFKTSVQENNEVIKILLERLRRHRLGKKSSEKSSNSSSPQDGESQQRTPRDQLPSKRYPTVPVFEHDVELNNPVCPCCEGKMRDTGMTEDIELLSVLPKRYLIYRFLKHKYSCGKCHGGMKTALLPPRILPGSSYGDDMMMDVALSKYCDLLPMERYVQMAARPGVEGLPPNSLIGLSHHLSDFLTPVCEKLKLEVLAAAVIHADETPHRMLEGGGGKSWFLWGFSTEFSCFFDSRDTRAGSVAGDFLKDSNCRYLLTDVFSGYIKGVADANTHRRQKGRPLIIHVWCNAHARRKFRESEKNFPEESRTFIASYREIYKLEKEVKEGPSEERASLRKKMEPFFAAMKRECEKLSSRCSRHSSLGKGIRYFLKNFEGLTRCLENPDIPLDNNAQERPLRAPVVGRKTWYGTHSKRGAETAAKLFSIVQACKLNGVNPREYFPYVVDIIHQSKEPPSPYEYSKLKLDKKEVISIPDG